MHNELVQLIVRTAGEVMREQDLTVPEKLDADTRLFGDSGVLDSMGLVSLVIAVEQAVQDAFGAPVALADEKALSRRQSPYRTIGTLASYAAEQLQASKA
jgi:acyl carrier protein